MNRFFYLQMTIFKRSKKFLLRNLNVDKKERILFKLVQLKTFSKPWMTRKSQASAIPIKI